MFIDPRDQFIQKCGFISGNGRAEQELVFLRDNGVKQRQPGFIDGVPDDLIHFHILPDLDSHILPVEQINDGIAAGDAVIHTGRRVYIEHQVGVQRGGRDAVAGDRDGLFRTGLGTDCNGECSAQQDDKQDQDLTHDAILNQIRIYGEGRRIKVNFHNFHLAFFLQLYINSTGDSAGYVPKGSMENRLVC